MRTDEELHERFDRAVERIGIPPGDVARVAARARQRARRQRVAGGLAGVVAVVAAAVVVPRVLAPSERFTVDPVATPTTAATASPTPEGTARPPLEVDHLRYGVGGVTRHRGEDRDELSSLTAQRARGLPDGGAVLQSGTGGPVVRVDPGGTEHELLPAVRGSRLLTVHDDRAWVTVRQTDAVDGDEEHLRSVPLDGTGWEDHGVSAGVEGFTDALAFLPGGGAVWLSCHLQCTPVRGDGLPGDPGGTAALTEQAGWYAGLAVSPAGDRLALVDGPDPVLGGTSDLAVLDPEGRELGRVRLPVGLALETAHVEFTADGEDLVAGDDAQAFVVRDWRSDAPTLVRLEGDAGVALLPGTSVEDDDATSVVRAFAEEHLGWDGALVGAPRPDGAQVAVTLRRTEASPEATVWLDRRDTGLRLSGGGHAAADHEDPSGWSVGVSADAGHIELSGRRPAWASGPVDAAVLPPHETGPTSSGAPLDDGRSFAVELTVPDQSEEPVTVLLTTLDGDGATSFQLITVPAGRFAAG